MDADEPISRDTGIQFIPTEDKKSIIVEADAAFAFDNHELNENGEEALEKCIYFFEHAGDGTCDHYRPHGFHR